MNNIQVLGKFLDQPMLVSKFQKAVPVLLTTGAAAFTAYDASKEKDPKKEARINFARNVVKFNYPNVSQKMYEHFEEIFQGVNE